MYADKNFCNVFSFFIFSFGIRVSEMKFICLTLLLVSGITDSRSGNLIIIVNSILYTILFVWNNTRVKTLRMCSSDLLFLL